VVGGFQSANEASINNLAARVGLGKFNGRSESWQGEQGISGRGQEKQGNQAEKKQFAKESGVRTVQIPLNRQIAFILHDRRYVDCGRRSSNPQIVLLRSCGPAVPGYFVR
jgi:hypothetical protein